MKTIFLWILSALLIAGCASDIPRSIRTPPAENMSLATVLQDPAQHQGASVRWGGIIASVENHSDESWIEIVEQALTKDGYPQKLDRSNGRFLARVAGFLDPVVYAPQRRITVSGTLDGVRQRQIGEHNYAYPLVHADQIYLWPLPAHNPPYYYPYGFSPWYPWGPPYYYRHHPH